MEATMASASARANPQAPAGSDGLIGQVRRLSRPLDEPAINSLLERIGDRRLVLLGEASHGTAEYYTWRAHISQRLIAEKGFSFIAVEGDWPDCYRLNRWIKGRPDSGGNAREVLHAFARWPTWMWANEEVVSLAHWLRRHNEGLAEGRRVGFYGLDVYSLWDSLYQVMAYLQRAAPEALPAARRAYQCFQPYGEDVQEYGRATAWVPAPCEDEAVALLQEVRRRRGGRRFGDTEDGFVAEQNALVVKNAEAYYRAMVRGGPESWNLRDRHMMLTLDRLLQHHGPAAKAIVWEHNTHVGDARFTDMADDGMVNIGQLARERWGEGDAFIAGFTSHRGRVIAAPAWDAPMERMRVPPARPGTWEDVLHRAADGGDRLLLFDADSRTEEMLQVRGQRAIGMVYHPEYEHLGNYVPTVLPRRYDALLFLDRTEALHSLHMQAEVGGEVPETYPSGV
jgi:erythromycin esterase-like protein